MSKTPPPPPTRYGNPPTVQPKGAPPRPLAPPPPTRYGHAPAAPDTRPRPAVPAIQAKAAGLPPGRPAAAQPMAARTGGPHAAPRSPAVAPPRGAVIQKMEGLLEEPMLVQQPVVDPMDAVIGVEDANFRARYHFTDTDFGEGAGYYTAAIAKLNGYVLGKYYSGNPGHAEDQALEELHKLTFAARRGREMFLEPPLKNRLTIYVTKSPCSSTYEVTEKGLGCAEEIIRNKTINGYDFAIKVRFGNYYTPKGIQVHNHALEKHGPKKRSELAMQQMGTVPDISTKQFDRTAKAVKQVTGRRNEAHPFKFITK